MTLKISTRFKCDIVGKNNVVSKDEVEVAGESIMMDDPNKLDLINHINSLKLLDISQAFDR